VAILVDIRQELRGHAMAGKNRRYTAWVCPPETAFRSDAKVTDDAPGSGYARPISGIVIELQ
jgi:hypothetical protein